MRPRPKASRVDSKMAASEDEADPDVADEDSSMDAGVLPHHGSDGEAADDAAADYDRFVEEPDDDDGLMVAAGDGFDRSLDDHSEIDLPVFSTAIGGVGACAVGTFGTGGRPRSGGGVAPADPDSFHNWQQNTHNQLSNAKALTRAAMKNNVDNEHTRVGSTKATLVNTSVVKHTIKKKMGITEDIIKALEDRIESVEDTIRQTGECLFQLQRAHRAKWAPLNVCERRLELRDGRPMSELIRDHTQEALENERHTLMESRQDLGDQVQTCKEMLVSLDAARNSLVEDLQHKRHGLRIDRGCLPPQKQLAGATGTMRDRLILPQLEQVAHYGSPPSPKAAAKGTGPAHEENRQIDSRTLIQQALRLEEDAMRLCNESDAIMLQTKRDCTRASTNAQNSLAKRVDETDDLKRRLESQIHETGEAIAQSEMSLAKTKKKLESHEMPLRALDKQFALRGRRTHREGIRDPVHEEMETHLESLKRNVKILSGKFNATKDLIDQLQTSKHRMQEDYRAKMMAMKIDDACLKVTARKAIELDRMDPRSGRCRTSAGAAAKKRRPYGGGDFTPRSPHMVSPGHTI